MDENRFEKNLNSITMHQHERIESALIVTAFSTGPTSSAPLRTFTFTLNVEHLCLPLPRSRKVTAQMKQSGDHRSDKNLIYCRGRNLNAAARCTFYSRLRAHAHQIRKVNFSEKHTLPFGCVALRLNLRFSS